MGEDRDAAHVNESKPGVITMLFWKKRAEIWKKNKIKNSAEPFQKTKKCGFAMNMGFG